MTPPPIGFLTAAGFTTNTTTTTTGTKIVPARQIAHTRHTPRCTTRAPTPHFHVCTGPCCSRAGSRALTDRLRALAGDPALASEASCLSACGDGPNVAVVPAPPQPAPAEGATRKGGTWPEVALERGVSPDARGAVNLLREHAAPVRADIEAALLAADEDHDDDHGGDAGARGPAALAGITAAQAAADAVQDTTPRLAATLLVRAANSATAVGAGTETAAMAAAAALRAVELAPRWPSAWEALAEAAEAAGDVERAMTAWRAWGRAAGRSKDGERRARKTERRVGGLNARPWWR